MSSPSRNILALLPSMSERSSKEKRVLNRFRACFLILGVLLFSASAFGQATPTAVYISGGPYIYNVQSNGSLVRVYDGTMGSIYGLHNNTVITANFSSLAIGPDNVDEVFATGDAMHPFLLYACDTKNNYIIRFDPTGNVEGNPSADLVYKNSLGTLGPVCGRSTSTGDFYVTNQGVPDPVNVYEFVGVANVGLGDLLASSPAVVALTGAGLPPGAVANAGLTQKNVGDLLLVDSAKGNVYRSPYGKYVSGTPFSTVPSSYITGLTSPKGIARISNGDIFVSTTVKNDSGYSTVLHFNSTPAPAANCPVLSLGDNSTIFFLAASETDIIYVATTVYNEGNLGELWSWDPANPNGCAMTQMLNPLPGLGNHQLSGVAVAPIPTAMIQPPLALPPNPTIYSFNSNELQIDTPSCTVNPKVTAYPLSLVNIETMIGLLPEGTFPFGATPGVNLGEEGYEMTYVVDWLGCQYPAASPNTIPLAIFGLYDTIAQNPDSVTNPQIVRCDTADNVGEPFNPEGLSYACAAITPIASFPLSGPIPFDNGLFGGAGTNSVFFLVNEKPTNVAADLGTFCNLFPPNGLKVETDGFVVVAFQLARTTGNCQTGPFISDAKVLLSAAQTTNGFFPILQLKTVFNLGTTFPQPGLCKFFPRFPLTCTYVLTIDVRRSGLTAGTYSLSLVPVTGNAGPQERSLTVVNEDVE